MGFWDIVKWACSLQSTHFCLSPCHIYNGLLLKGNDELSMWQSTTPLHETEMSDQTHTPSDFHLKERAPETIG
jgi:hypothetical protein